MTITTATATALPRPPTTAALRPGWKKRPRPPPSSSCSSCPSSANASSISRRRLRRRRIRDLERSAALRALSGNGACPDGLPPLPAASGEEGGDDLSPLFAHPYGVLPHGNVHASSSGDAVRTRGLGPHLRRLNDEQISTVLSYVDGPSLGGGVAIASRFLYVFGHQDELWRDLTLRRWGERGIEVPPLAPPPEPVDRDCEDNVGGEGGSCGCWKDIYARNHLLDAGRPEESRRRHIPLRVAGVYSDVLFRPFLCRSFALRPSWLSVHTVPTLDREEVTTERFLREYEEKNMPLLIRGASRDWPALGGGGGSQRRWTAAYLTKTCEEKTFRATSGAAPLPAKFGMEDYMNYCARSAEEAPLYLFDRTFASQCPELLEDFDCALRKSCPWWAPGNKEAGHDLFGVLGEGKRPDHQWLIVGPKRSGSCFHIDPNCTHAWNAPIVGSKRWIFYPPGASPPGVHPSPSGDDVCMPISLGEWFLSYWDSHVARRSDADPRRRPLECTARPGDVLFVPHGWWHMVLNLGDEDDGGDAGGSGDRSCSAVSVALTRNYVSASNLPDVLRFLDTRVGQISGCRDRDEAVKPENLGREFRRALQSTGTEEAEDGGEEKKCDDKEGKWVDLLEISEKRAKKGWSCAAWVDLPTSCDASDAAMDSMEDEKEKSPTGSSILARAKEPSRISGVGTGSPTPSSGFSFSFV